MIYFVNRDGRICIFYAVHGKIIAGATDIPAEDPEAVCDEAEVDYILEAMRLAFPSIHVDRSHVVFRFCGVRPLPRSDALTPGQISRDHSFPALGAGRRNRFPDLLAGGRQMDHLPRAGRAGGRRTPAGAGTPASARFGGSSHRRRQGLSAHAGGYRTAAGALGGARRNAMAPGRRKSPLTCGRARIPRWPLTPVIPAARSNTWRSTSASSISTTWSCGER